MRNNSNRKIGRAERKIQRLKTAHFAGVATVIVCRIWLFYRLH